MEIRRELYSQYKLVVFGVAPKWLPRPQAFRSYSDNAKFLSEYERKAWGRRYQNG